jgi:hypothetical protein
MIEIPQTPELRFDERNHIYTLNGVRIPSVTTVMRLLSEAYYGGIDYNVLTKAANRGTAVHQAIENYLKFGVVDVPAEYRGYFKAAMAWLEERKPDIVSSEGRVYHRILRYAGTADIICAEAGGALICIDFKTSAQIVEMLVRVQLEAYVKAFGSHGLKFKEKRAVHLGKDGKHDIKSFPSNDNEAWDVFCGLLTVHNYINQYRR